MCIEKTWLLEGNVSGIRMMPIGIYSLPAKAITAAKIFMKTIACDKDIYTPDHAPWPTGVHMDGKGVIVFIYGGIKFKFKITTWDIDDPITMEV